VIFVSNSWKFWLASLFVSLGIFAILYFTVIKPTTDTANDAVRTSLEQSNEQLNQAQQQLKDVPGSTAGAQKQLSDAEQLTQCLSDAGTDTAAIAGCNAQFGG